MVTALTFAMLGAAAGLAGTLNSARSGSALPSDDFNYVFSVIAAIVVGAPPSLAADGPDGAQLSVHSSCTCAAPSPCCPEWRDILVCGCDARDCSRSDGYRRSVGMLCHGGML